MSAKTERELTPKQIHYLKRELITLQLQKELTLLAENATLRPLFPVDNPANGLAAGLAVVPTSIVSLRSDTPLLRYAFNRFVLTFPLLQDTDRTEFWGKVQRFLDEFRKLGITGSAERSELSKRKKIMQKIERLLVLFYGFGIKIQADKEESIRVAEEIEKERSRDTIAKITSLTGEETIVKWMGMNGVEINVVTVKDIVEKKHMVEVPHAQFVIETKIDNKEAVYVGRRYGQFRTLFQELKHIHPTIEIPQVPPKSQNIFNRVRPTEHHLYRERDRLSLRSFLHRIAADPHLARSDVFIKFLTTDSFKLNHEESYNAERRAEMDNIRADQEKAFREQVDRRVEELNGQLEGLKKELMKPGGLTKLFETIKTTPNVSDLPISLQKAMDWGQINFAFVLHTQFLTSDDAAQNFATLKRTHALVPYRTLRTVLRLSNPISMVRGVLDVFLAQPFGASSLFQRILMANLNEEAKTFQHDIADLEKTIGDPTLCQKVHAVVYAPQAATIDPSLSPIEQVFVLLRTEGVGPTLTPDQIARIAPATQPGSAAGIHARVLVRKLRQLWVLQMRKRDQEMLMELVTQGIAGDLLKDIFAIFYKPLAQVYKAANIGDTLMDVSAFIDDLVQLVESIDTEEMNNTVEPFIDLVRRHEARFYTFVHSVHSNDTAGIFDGLLTYIDTILGGVSRGLLTKRLDLDGLVITHVPLADQSILVAEIDAVCEYHLARKARRLERIRRRTAAAAAAEGRGLDVEMESILKEMGGSHEEVNGVLDDVQELQFESDEDEDDGDEEWEEMEMQADDDGVEVVTSKFNASKWWKGKDTEAEIDLKPPTLTLIPKLVQPFVDVVITGLITE